MYNVIIVPRKWGGRVGLEERGGGGSNEASWGKYMLLSIGIADGLKEVCDRLLVVLFHPHLALIVV